MNLFPVDVRAPIPDLTSLRNQLVARGFMLEPRGRNIPSETLFQLWNAVEALKPELGEHRFPFENANAPLVIGLLRSVGIVPRDLEFDFETLLISEFVNGLRAGGTLPLTFVFESEKEFLSGPLFGEFANGLVDELFCESDTYITLRTSDRVSILIGGEVDHTPFIPNTDRKVEDWIGFIDRWYEDQNERWIDPETGRAYDLLELDWHYTLGAARWWIKIFRGGWKNPEKACAFIEELTGLPMTYCWTHI
ncbi:MAG TPA: hypothetical protein VEU47_13065 [Candidatus Cybelea sp.]|nr:hypothetical protein [Candidatus Cybelea sp.]